MPTSSPAGQCSLCARDTRTGGASFCVPPDEPFPAVRTFHHIPWSTGGEVRTRSTCPAGGGNHDGRDLAPHQRWGADRGSRPELDRVHGCEPFRGNPYALDAIHAVGAIGPRIPPDREE